MQDILAGMGAGFEFPTQIEIKKEIYWCDCDGQVIILDMSRGKYFALDSAGSSVWKHLSSGLGFHELTTTIAREFAEDPIQVAPHVAESLRVLVTQGLIKPRGVDEHLHEQPDLRLGTKKRKTTTVQRASGKAGRLSGIVRLSLHVRAYFILIFVDLGLSLFGFHGLLGKLSRRHAAKPDFSIEMPEVKSLCDIALSVFRWYRPHVACMHRALAIYWFLRSLGISAELCLGVTSRPFCSHAWAEFAGHILGDVPGVKKSFHTIARFA